MPQRDASRLVFLDETWATTNMAPRYGRAPRGQRALDATPHGRWKTTTFVGAMRAEGFVAPLVLDGAINGATFRAYVEQMLAPSLAPGDVVVMDNLSSHKVTGVREAIEARGAALLCLPPYPPDLNSIEMAFAKLKAMLRRARHRTRDALWNGIGRILDSFSSSDCQRYLAHHGYGQPG
jgi:transposase